MNCIPQPQYAEVKGGNWQLQQDIAIGCTDVQAKHVAQFFADKISRSTGLNISVANKGDIMLEIDRASGMADEGYRLSVTPTGVRVSASTPQGLFRGMSTFMQLLPAEIESMHAVKGVNWQAQCVEIADEPRFAYRGLMIDVSRHFIGVDALKKHIDMLSTLKINKLHLHLSDYQGWRIEIKRYPKLTDVGAWRRGEWGGIYGGYYTQEEMRDVVKYASQRFIDIIPEIDVPGHTMAAIAAYPELSCTGEPQEVMSRFGGHTTVFCPGKETMFTMLDGIFAELAEIFPGEYFHIGGDECRKNAWKRCPDCQKRISELGLTEQDGHSAEERLQSYAISRCEKILAKYGKKMIGWDEILQGGLAPEATVMSWRGESGGIKAATMGHNVIMTPGSGGMYLDHYQDNKFAEPQAWGGYAPLSKTYAYNPVPDTLVTMGKQQYVIGVQGNAWSECMPNEAVVEYRVYPRIAAIAEVGWTNVENKNYEHFCQRMETERLRMDCHGINYHIPIPVQPDECRNHVVFTGDSVQLSFVAEGIQRMVYTLNGNNPLPTSPLYSGPITFTDSGELRIASLLPSGKMSEVRTVQVVKQDYAKALQMVPQHQGIRLRFADACVREMCNVADISDWRDSVASSIKVLSRLRVAENGDAVPYVAVAEGFVNVPQTAVYEFAGSATQVCIDGQVVVDNDRRAHISCLGSRSMALEAGWHTIKVTQISNVIGGWSTQQRNSGEVTMRPYGSEKPITITDQMLAY
ncbi:MAG: family 20 glycosylhydrolase [Muribaculaceae bacterium]